MLRVLGWAALLAGAALGQSSSKANSPGTGSSGPSSSSPGFEVASVRAYRAPVDQPIVKNPGVSALVVSGNRVELRRATLKDLVMAAYNVKEFQVTGGPGWAAGPDGLFDIAATTTGTPGVVRVRGMLRNLLTERFHLQLRREEKPLPVYELVVAKGGLKLKEAALDRAPAPNMERGSMMQIAALVSLYLDRPVFDKTGLTGVYEYSSGLRLLDMGAADSAEVIARTLAELQGRMGLKAQAGRAKVETLVIVSAERPAEN
ncbi:MAG TPA: TIGR03435 family protein [Bryobacteraceae bacterium]|jgi:uncharacterized protein (TIGR03435 family)